MTKLHKIEMYILDIDEQYGSLQDTIDHINDRLELVSLHPYNIKTVEFDWSDEHKLNKNDIGYEDCKGMFVDQNVDNTLICCNDCEHNAGALYHCGKWGMCAVCTCNDCGRGCISGNELHPISDKPKYKRK